MDTKNWITNLRQHQARMGIVTLSMPLLVAALQPVLIRLKQVLQMKWERESR